MAQRAAVEGKEKTLLLTVFILSPSILAHGAHLCSCALGQSSHSTTKCLRIQVKSFGLAKEEAEKSGYIVLFAGYSSPACCLPGS